MTMPRSGKAVAATQDLPESLGYSIKRRLLGPPLINEQLAEERLSKPLALGVLSCDGISSAAYGTEEILIELVRVLGYTAAFAILLPMTCSTARSCPSTPGPAARTWSRGRTSARGWPRSPRSRC